MMRNKIQHETNRFVSVKHAINREKNNFNKKIKNIINAVLVSGNIFNEAYQCLQTAIEFTINNIK